MDREDTQMRYRSVRDGEKIVLSVTTIVLIDDLTFENVAVESAEGVTRNVEEQQVLNAGESTVLHVR